MNHPVWQLDLAHCRASLDINQLSTEVYLDNPQLGWQALQYEGRPISLAPAQVHLPGHGDQSSLMPAAMHVRGTDMVAKYLPTDSRCFTTQIYRSVEHRRVGKVDLLVMATLVSLNTHLLDAQVELTFQTDRPADSELLRSTQTDFQIADEGSPAEGPPTALLLRPADGQHSYVELWHAIDYAAFSQATHYWQHSFAEALEKGVIRRLLLWSVLVPRADDLVLAADLQQQFSQTAPPLTT